MDAAELDKVADFLSSIAEVEKLTGIDFGDRLRDADVRKGRPATEIKDEAAIPLAPQASSRARSRPPRGRRIGGK